MSSLSDSSKVTCDNSSESFHEAVCSPCSKDGKLVHGVFYCVECTEALCSMCVKQHNKFEKLQNHVIIKNDDVRARVAKKQESCDSELPPLPTETCGIHHDKVLDMYCARHDTVGCMICIATEHRDCKDVEYIPRVASNMKTSEELAFINKEVMYRTNDIETLTTCLKSELNRIENTETQILCELKEERDSIVKHIDHLEKLAKTEIQEKGKHIRNIIAEKLKGLNEVSLKLESKKSNLCSFNKHENRSQLFVDMNQTKQILSPSDSLIQKVDSDIGKQKLKFTFNKTRFDICNKQSLGSLTKKSLYVRARCHGQFNVKSPTDKFTCRITCTCLMTDGSIILTDGSNRKIKRFSKSYSFESEKQLSCAPLAVCRTGPTDFAVALYDNKEVHILSSASTFVMKHSFNVADRCHGLAYSQGKLFVSCGGWFKGREGQGQIHVYTSRGEHVRVLPSAENDPKLFTFPLHIAINDTGKKLHVADQENGIVTMTTDGAVERVFKNKRLTQYIGVTATEGDSFIACGYTSHNVVMVTGDEATEESGHGAELTELLSEKDVHSPRSVLYDTSQSRLVVSMRDNNYISVYDLLPE